MASLINNIMSLEKALYIKKINNIEAKINYLVVNITFQVIVLDKDD